jgi:hypothetical protein
MVEKMILVGRKAVMDVESGDIAACGHFFTGRRQRGYDRQNILPNASFENSLLQG